MVDQRARGDHLRYGDVRAERSCNAAVRPVGHARHRGQHDGVFNTKCSELHARAFFPVWCRAVYHTTNRQKTQQSRVCPYGHDCGTQKTPSGWMAFFHGAGYGNTPAALPPPCRLGNCFDLRPKPSVFHTAAGLAPEIAGRSNHGFVAGPLQQKSAPIF